MSKHETLRDPNGWLAYYDRDPVLPFSVLPKSDSSSPKRHVVNLKGCNGSGKSTIPMQLLARSKQALYLTASKDDKRPVGVYVPQLRVVILGLYSPGVNCGGCDALGNTQIVKELLKLLWKKDVHIMYEGVIVGDIRSTFYELMIAFNTVHERIPSFCFMNTPLKTCLERIQKRNGGKVINEDLVRQKYRNSCVQFKYYLEAGDIDVKLLNTTGSKDAVYERFLGLYPDLRTP